MRIQPLLAAALLGLLAIPFAAGHGAPSGDIVPNGPFSRVLADYSDDCGADNAATASPNCNGSNDLIALDIQEKYDAAAGELVVFRFTMAAGQTGSGTLKDSVSFQAGSAQKGFDLMTTDNSHFTGTADQVMDARSLNDGTRFQVDAILKLSSLGSVGTKLHGFQVNAFRGSTAGDLMPGTYKTALGTDGPAPAADASCGCPRNVDYTLQGTGYYLDLTAPTGSQTATVGQDLPSPIQITLANKLNKAQTVTVTADGADGVTAGFHAGGDGMGAMEFKPSVEVALQGKDSTILHLNLHGERAGASGTLTVTATTDAGGRSVQVIPYTVQDAGSGTTTGSGMGTSDTTSAMPDTQTSTSKGSPAPAAVLVGLVLLGAALRRRA